MVKNFYLLVHTDTKKPLYLKLPKKHFILIANDSYFLFENDIYEFTLAEKLCVLNNTNKFTWKKISPIELIFRRIFFNTTTPFNFELYPLNNQVAICINGKIEGRLFLQ